MRGWIVLLLVVPMSVAAQRGGGGRTPTSHVPDARTSFSGRTQEASRGRHMSLTGGRV